MRNYIHGHTITTPEGKLTFLIIAMANRPYVYGDGEFQNTRSHLVLEQVST